MEQRPKRKQIRLKGYDYSQNGYYFITICTQDRNRILSEIKIDEDNFAHIKLLPAGEIIDNVFPNICSRYNVQIEHLIIMPDHIHFILIKNNFDKWTLGNIIGAYKSITTRLVNQYFNVQGQKFWQRNYYEHIIQNKNDYNEIVEYIINNPQREIMKREGIV